MSEDPNFNEIYLVPGDHFTFVCGCYIEMNIFATKISITRCEHHYSDEADD